MTQTMLSPADAFVDRRTYPADHPLSMRERRQFVNSHEELSLEASELARAIDQYKLVHRRRFITFDLSIVLGSTLS